MRIAIVNAFYPPHAMGGAEHSVRLLAQGLASQGHIITIITSGAKASIEQDGILRILRVRLREPFWGFEIGRQNGILKAFWHVLDMYNPLNGTLIRQVLLNENPDVVHTNTLQGFSVSIWKTCYEMGIPIIHTLRDYYLMCRKCTAYHPSKIREPLDCRLWSIPRRLSSKHVAAVVGVSQFILTKHIQANYFSNAKIKCHIYNPGQEVPLRKVVKSSGRVIFGFAGVIAPYKGIENIVKVFSGLTDNIDTELRLFGRPHNKQFLRKLISQCNPAKVKYCGHQPTDDIYQQVDFMVISALWDEPFPRTLIESYSYGVPVLAALRGGIPEKVQDGETGYLFDPTDESSIRRGLMNLYLSSAQARETMASRCFEISKQLKSNDVCAKYVDVYVSALNDSRRQELKLR